MKEIIKELIIKDLISTYGPINGIEELIQVRENKDLSKGEYSISFHAFTNALNKKIDEEACIKVAHYIMKKDALPKTDENFAKAYNEAKMMYKNFKG